MRRTGKAARPGRLEKVKFCFKQIFSCAHTAAAVLPLLAAREKSEKEHSQQLHAVLSFYLLSHDVLAETRRRRCRRCRWQPEHWQCLLRVLIGVATSLPPPAHCRHTVCIVVDIECINISLRLIPRAVCRVCSAAAAAAQSASRPRVRARPPRVSVAPRRRLLRDRRRVHLSAPLRAALSMARSVRSAALSHRRRGGSDAAAALVARAPDALARPHAAIGRPDCAPKRCASTRDYPSSNPQFESVLIDLVMDWSEWPFYSHRQIVFFSSPTVLICQFLVSPLIRSLSLILSFSHRSFV
jgi:hypothetical protein